MRRLLLCLNAFQRSILHHMLLENAQLTGWNSVAGRECLHIAARVRTISGTADHEEKMYYETSAKEFALRTM